MFSGFFWLREIQKTWENAEIKHVLLRPHTKHEAQLLSETRTGTEEQLQKFKLAEEELAQVKVLSWVVILSI